MDRSRTGPIRGVRFNQQVPVIGRVARVASRRTRRGQTMLTVTVFDGSGYLDLTFFNQPWVAGTYRQGVELAVSGLAQSYRGRLQLANQEVEVLRGEDADTVHVGRITPVHRATDGITTRTIRELVWTAIQGLRRMPEPMPADIVRAEDLIEEDVALREIHFPPDDGPYRGPGAPARRTGRRSPGRRGRGERARHPASTGRSRRRRAGEPVRRPAGDPGTGPARADLRAADGGGDGQGPGPSPGR